MCNIFLEDSSWEEYNSDITNGLALALFDLWQLPDVKDAILEKTFGRHKKIELEGMGDGEWHYFYEASCRSDRPAWLVEEHASGTELFHFYNAMGLSRQHEMLQSLLARVFVSKRTKKVACVLAVSFLSHIATLVPGVSFHPELVSYDNEDIGAEFRQALEEFRSWNRDCLTPSKYPYNKPNDLASYLDANFPLAEDR